MTQDGVPASGHGLGLDPGHVTSPPHPHAHGPAHDDRASDGSGAATIERVLERTGWETIVVGDSPMTRTGAGVVATPCIISVAITGSLPRKSDNPAVPISVVEQIESTQAAFEAGASLVHVHVRNDDESVSSDPDRFAAFQVGIVRHCPGMIVQFSTGGRGRSMDRRASMLHLRPDMASLTPGSVNFPNMVYENSPEFVRDLARVMQRHSVKPEIEIFDLSMLYATADLVAEGLLDPQVHVQFVMGIRNAMPARREVLDFEVAQLRALLPEATWSAAGIGRHQLDLNRWTLELGGHCRTGLEDNIRLDRSRLADSNAQLVGRVASLCCEAGRAIASPQQARRILGLRR